MPSKSKQQQKFMGIVRSIQKGEAPAGKFSKAAQKAAKSMKKGSVKKYAKTKHDDLPVKKESLSKSQIKKMRDEFKKTGDLPPHLKKLVKGKKEFEKKFKVKNVVIPGMEWMSKLGEERDYKDEYKKFQSSTKSKKYRAELNKYNRKKGTYGNGDGKDASHKGGKIVGFESESKNRGRAEKSRLKKEGALNENPAAIAAATAMTKIKMNNPKTGKKISAVTALRNKDNPNHKKAKSIFQRLKDKFSKKKKEEPKKLSADSPEGKKAAAAAGVSVGSFTRESVNEAKDPKIIAQIRDVLKNGITNIKDPVSGKKMKVDSYSASAIIQVYDKINRANKKKFEILSLPKMAKLAMKFVK